MPNLVPPLAEVKDVIAYQEKLKAQEPTVDFLMSLYLTSNTTPETIIEAKKAGITGVKSVCLPLNLNMLSHVITWMRISHNRFWKRWL